MIGEQSQGYSSLLRFSNRKKALRYHTENILQLNPSIGRKAEAAESIAAVIAQYENTPEFLGIYAQAGAASFPNAAVAVGVAPTISDLRFPKGQPATRLRPSATTAITI